MSTGEDFRVKLGAISIFLALLVLITKITAKDTCMITKATSGSVRLLHSNTSGVWCDVCRFIEYRVISE